MINDTMPHPEENWESSHPSTGYSGQQYWPSTDRPVQTIFHRTTTQTYLSPQNVTYSAYPPTPWDPNPYSPPPTHLLPPPPQISPPDPPAPFPHQHHRPYPHEAAALGHQRQQYNLPPAPPPVIYLPSSAQTQAGHIAHEIRDEDVLCGRGAPTMWHRGNQFFKNLVIEHQSEYLASRRSEKPQIAAKVVHSVRERGGRFLKRTKVPGLGPSGHFRWEEIGEQRAYEKACQALRENAPEIRRRFAANIIAKHLASVSVDSHSQGCEDGKPPGGGI